MYQLDFFGSYSVSVTGSGSVTQGLKDYYSHFVDDSGEIQDPDMRVREWEEQPEPDTILGDPEQYYGRSSERFIIKQRNNFISINRDWDQISCSPETSYGFIKYFIEYKLRKELSDQGYALIHASGVDVDGTTYVFPAWRHTGKTNTMLSLLASGGGYLSDDRVWVSRSGTVRGYPLPVNLLPYNFNSFPDLFEMSSMTEIRASMSEMISDKFDQDRSLFDKALLFLNTFYIESGLNKVLTLDSIFSDSYFVSEENIDHLIFLRTKNGKSQSDVRIDNIDSDSAMSELSVTSSYEWNSNLKEYLSTFDLLFPDADKESELDDLVEKETAIFRDLVTTSNIHRLHLPREEKWNENGITQKVIDEIDRLE